MRPYLAIIKDSFRAALASRVLFVLLLLITLLLLALAPLHVRETLDWYVSGGAVRNWNQLPDTVVQRRESSQSVERIWELLSPEIQKRLSAIQSQADENPAQPETSVQQEDTVQDEGEDQGAVVDAGRPDIESSQSAVEQRRLSGDLLEELNEVIERRDFYRSGDWERESLHPEARQLIEEGVETLSEVRMKRLNRLLVASALSPEIDPGNPSALELYYAIWKFPVPISLTHPQFAQVLTSILPYYFDKFVLSIGLLVAIIVTANLIPDTFEPGSLNLLLSKPISRWGLFTAKFFGGCVFIALCAAYLFVGVWLWLGLAMGIWDRATLFSIPLYIIVFAIYFSVSAVIGLIWRSPIVSVILTLIFWVACFSAGMLYGVFDTKMVNDEICVIVPATDRVLTVDMMQQISSWDESKREWKNRLSRELEGEEKVAMVMTSYTVKMRDVGESMKNSLRPVFDHRNNRVLATQAPMMLPFVRSNPLLVAGVDDLNFKPIGHLPSGTTAVYETQTGMVGVTHRGKFFKLNQAEYGAAFKEAHDSAGSARAATDGQKQETARKLFDPAGPAEAFEIGNRHQVDYSYSRDEFVIYNHGVVKVYENRGDSYQLRLSRELQLEFKPNMTAMVAFGKDQIAIAFGNGQVDLLSASRLESIQSQQPERRSGVREIASSPDGRYFGVMYRNGNLWIADSQDQSRFSKRNLDGQGQVCAFAFGENGRCWIGYDTDRVTELDLVSGARQNRLVPGNGLFAGLYRWLIRPLYRVFPKPGEFYKVVSYLAASGDAATNKDVDLNLMQPIANPWSPLVSGVAFMVGMLMVGCAIFYFRDY